MRKAIRVLVAALSLTCALGSATGYAQAGPEQKRLDSFAGRWRVELDIKASAAVPASKASGTDECEWFANMHMVCKSDAGAYRAMRVISYIPATKQYGMYSVDSYGYASFAMGQLQGNTWTFATDVAGVKYRTVIDMGGDGYSSKAEYAGADGKWIAMSETKATKLK